MLTTDQVLALAPDPSSAAAARKLAHPRDWRNLGQSELALWGECQGSALYQVRVDLSDRAAKCSCPSRKFPCKHALALMLMAAAQPDLLAASEPPAWVSDWLQSRARTAERREQSSKATPPDPAAQAKRAGQRLDRVREGIDALELWMQDLVRNGLASVEAMGMAPWEAQAARLVDAQAPGLASRLRGLAFIPRATANWADDLLGELGRLALLTRAFRRIDDLDPALQADVRQLVGWTLKEDEVVAHRDLAEDDWLVAGQWAEDDERFRIQRTWLKGIRTGRVALILQFAAGNATFAESFLPATHFEAVLAFWPSAFPQRALVLERKSPAVAWNDRLPGSDTLAAFLLDASSALARHPWLGRSPCFIRDVVPVPSADEAWSLVDRERASLPLGGGDAWSLLAISGGRAIDVMAEWDGRALRPLFASAYSERTTWARRTA
jgi:SWIM zinc finger